MVEVTVPGCTAAGGNRHKTRSESTAIPSVEPQTRAPGRVAREGPSKYEKAMGKISVGYIRVSTDRQRDGDSLPAQRARLNGWATANGFELIALHSDEGISGASMTNRPGVNAAVDDACRLRCPLVVVSLSRLVRSVSDAINVGERLAARGADLVSLSEQIDTTTASGRLVFKLLALLGEFERELVAERTTSVLHHMASQGLRTGGLPYGYTLAADGDHLTPDPAEQATIVNIQAWREGGFSLREIARRLESSGIKSKGGGHRWRPGTISAILRRAPAVAAGAA